METSSDPEAIYQVILRFIKLVEQGTDSELGNAQLLEKTLDELAMAVHFVGDEFDPSNLDAPKIQTSELWALIEKRFPKLGLYNVPSNLYSCIAESEIMVGSAIDDIVDITIDLTKVLWYWKNTSEQDALWHFKFGYRTHWGAHLRSLQNYLYERIKDI